jgi:hypothetical protein
LIFFHCLALPHPHGQQNNARFNLLTWSTVRLDTDGYEQIDSMIRILQIRKLSTLTHIKLDVDANKSLDKTPSIEKLQSSLNQTSEGITTISKTLTTTATVLTDA